ncbi:MAG TPA: FixH family protein [Bauldia sp.]|nr:FixH family protein [Bauldia sp.]
MPFRDFFRVDDDHPFTGRHMLAVILLFFGAIIAVNVVMVVSATGTFPGLVVGNSYVASQNYNQVLAAGRAQTEAGWQMKFDQADGVISVALVDRRGNPVTRLDVTAMAGRPSTTGEDRTISLIENDMGYRAVAPLAPGLWDVAIEARKDGVRVFGARERVHVPRTGTD